MSVFTTSRWLAVSLLAVLALAAPVRAYTLEEFTFEDPARFAEFRDLIGTLRCLVCQNESLAGSQAGVAQDLRREVYRMMQEGQSREQVVAFLVERYGDFVLYEPPLRPATYVLWFGPFLLLAGGAALLLVALRRRQRAPEPELDANERRRLQQLLAGDGASGDPR